MARIIGKEAELLRNMKPYSRFFPCPICHGKGQFGMDSSWAAALGEEPPEYCGGSGDGRDYMKNKGRKEQNPVYHEESGPEVV